MEQDAAVQEQPPLVYLLPFEGLSVPSAWSVGRVTFHPSATARALIDNAPAAPGYEDRLDEVLADADGGAIAQVTAGDIEEAVDLVSAGVDGLRLFQLTRTDTRTTTFGLPGDIHRARLRYVVVGEKRSAVGGRFRGDSAGWHFSTEDLEDWRASPTFGFLAQALTDLDNAQSEGARRARLGTQLLARAALEHRPDLKMLGIIAALEAWLLCRDGGPQTMRLARHVAWFGCGLSDGDLCGRDRPICPYLLLDPGGGKESLQRLKSLRALGDTYTAWRCSEWHRVVDWYGLRSSGAHGDSASVDAKEAGRAEYHVARQLAIPILEWLRLNPTDPVGRLGAAITEVREPDDWQDIMAALDARQPAPPARP